MKKYLLTIPLILFFISNAVAEDIPGKIQQKPVACFALDELLNHLKKEFGETIKRKFGKLDIWPTEALMTENEEQGSWTIIEYKDNTACVLASGRGDKKV